MLNRKLLAGTLGTLLLAAPAYAGSPGADGSVLPFPPVPSASVAAPTLQASRHQRREGANHLPAGAPNILIILLDDVGFGLPGTYGGDIRTPTLSRIATSMRLHPHLWPSVVAPQSAPVPMPSVSAM